MASTLLSMLVTLSLGSIPTTSANEFLKAPKVLVEQISEEEIRTSLLDEVESTLGAGSASNRLSQMETILQPIVAALPKNEHGKLGHTAVAYALHRLFVLRHGWVIKGLSSQDGSWNASSPAGVLADQVPSYIEAMFEERLGGKGFGLNEVAVLAATIEHLIHNEAVSRLGNAFNVHMLPVISPLNDAEASTVLDTYMMSYILGENLGNLTLHLAQVLSKSMDEIFLAWGDTQKFVRDIKNNVTENAGEVDFAALAKVVEVVGEQFGTFQDLECRQLKEKLVKMEYHGTGRVKLADFYRPALDGAWTFQESAGYLHSLGVLDQSDPMSPSVIIANYVTSPANCIASSGFYQVCCKNECESLLGHLEAKIGASEAKPDTIVDIISKLPSSTTTPSQKLSASLRQHLDDIAASHLGTVPLHGRLFAQWMHHIYPRECPFPQISGTIDYNAADMLKDSSEEARATQEEMMHFVGQTVESTDSDVTYDLPVEEISPWSSEEELFVAQSFGHSALSQSSTSGFMRSIVLLAAAGSLSLAFTQALKIPLQGTPEKYTI